MKPKYIIIFLMGLLSLVSSKELFSQHCLNMSYDKNGNRISLMTKDCVKYMRGDVETYDELEVDEEYLDELLVYPNPNDGRFKIKLNSEGLADVSIYDNKGILIDNLKFADEVDVDISDNPAGVYLLRIIKDDDVRSVIVVKL